MGWHNRKKSHHYDALSGYVYEIAAMLGIDAWNLMADWFVSRDKCLDRESCRIELAAEVDEFISKIKDKYSELGINREPVVFIKNDSGTYGLGILSVHSGTELLSLSNRKMKKLMYSKGGVEVENFLIQEGIPTRLHTGDGGPVEPVVYLLMDKHRGSIALMKRRVILKILILQVPCSRAIAMLDTYTARMLMAGTH